MTQSIDLKIYPKQKLRELIDLNNPKPPNVVTGVDSTGYSYKCPRCGLYVGPNKQFVSHMDLTYESHCPRCGQKLDWVSRGIHPGWGAYEHMREAATHYRKDDEDE